MTEKQKAPYKMELSLLGFFFGPAYFAGYGKFAKGALMAFLGGFPVLNFGIAGYGMVQARKELPIKQQPFNWGKALAIVALQIVCAFTITWMLTNFQQTSIANQRQELIESVSGVWTDSKGGQMEVNLSAQQPYVKVQGNPAPVTLAEVDIENQVISMNIQIPNQGTWIWTLRKLINDKNDGFTLLFTLHTGDQEELAFVRNLL